MMRRLAGVPATALLAGILFAWSAFGFIARLPAADAGQQTVQVDLVHGYSPKTLDIKTGTTVVWQNIERTDYPVVRGAHTVTSDDGKTFDSGEFLPGTSFALTFNAPGTYAYHCKIHPQLLRGQLTITGPVIRPPATKKEVDIVEPQDPNKWGYTPKDVTGTVGLTITWRNNGRENHTVTAKGAFDKLIKPGQTWEHTFKDPIYLKYYCSLHPWMKGTVRVASANGKLPTGPPSSNGPPPNTSVAQPSTSSAGPVTFHVNVIEPSEVKSWGYAPSVLRARKGDTVVWTNTGGAPHTVTATNHAFDSGSIQPNGTYSFKPTALGNISYFCSIHPWMKGSLIIVAAGTKAVVVPPPKTSTGGTTGQSPGTGTSLANGNEPTHSGARTRLAASVISAILILGIASCWPTLAELRRRRRHPPDVVTLNDAEASEPRAGEDRTKVRVGV
jgi:plastocyanin